MKFRNIATSEAKDAVLAHSVRLPDLTLAKGRQLNVADLEALIVRGIHSITVAQLEPDDIGENEAAARAAASLVGGGVLATPAHTGRVNLQAHAHGLLKLDPAAINALNAIDEAITIATLSPYDVVRPSDIIATVKVIPLAVADHALQAWEAAGSAIEVMPFMHRRVSLIQTRLDGTKDSVLAKTRDVTAQRLNFLGATLVEELRVAHDVAAVVPAIAARLNAGDELLFVCGASSIIDRNDIIPAAIVASGGTVDHFGMPVDPGNLLLVGHIGEVPVVGLPGCARSPKLNGMDFVLRRLLAGVPVGPREIQAMGVGGLLKDLPERPMPRVVPTRAVRAVAGAGKGTPRIGAVILAAGRSSRMGQNKLLLDLDGRPLVRRVAEAALAAGFQQTVVVVGHEAEKVRTALAGLDVEVAENDDYGIGLSTSLQRGIAAMDADVDGALICLGDMPDVDARLLRRLALAFDPVEGRAIVVPVCAGKRGNPILWGRQFFPELTALRGDVGARHLIGEHAEWVSEIEIAGNGIFTDLDTPDAVAKWKASRSE